jgi:hypothetical protein
VTHFIRRLHEDERGDGLIEALVSSALVGIALMFLVGSLSTFAIASRTAEDRAIAQAFVRAQAAKIVAAPYAANGDYTASYDPLPTAAFLRTVNVTWWDGTSAWSVAQNANGLQKVVLTISQVGKPLTSLEFAKALR